MRGKLNLKRTRNKLLKNGYLPDIQNSYQEVWIDVRSNGAPISFTARGENVDGALKVHGRRPDVPEADAFYADYTRNVKEAIELSRVGCSANG